MLLLFAEALCERRLSWQELSFHFQVPYTPYQNNATTMLLEFELRCNHFTRNPRSLHPTRTLLMAPNRLVWHRRRLKQPATEIVVARSRGIAVARSHASCMGFVCLCSAFGGRRQPLLSARPKCLPMSRTSPQDTPRQM